MSSKYWIPEGSPVASVLLVHGMCEHIGRYDGFAKELNKKGYAVFAEDLLGHGPECPTLGYCDGDMWQLTLEQIRKNYKALKEKYPKIPTIVFGHSYGSFLLQTLVPELGADGYILSGSSAQSDKDLFTKLYEKACAMPQSEKAQELADLSFNSYNAEFEAEGKNAWLSRDNKEVQKYNSDPLCGFVVSASFYKGMYGGLLNLCNPDFPPAPANPVPIMVMSGSKDPVGRFGEGVKDLYNLYKDRGYPAVLNLYEEGRHEMLNETNKADVIKDILDFLGTVVK